MLWSLFYNKISFKENHVLGTMQQAHIILYKYTCIYSMARSFLLIAFPSSWFTFIHSYVRFHVSLYGHRRNKRTGRGHLTHAYLISLHAKVSNSIVTPCMWMWIACEYIYSWEYLWEPLGPVSTCLWTRDLITSHWCAKLDFLVWEYCHVRTLFSTGYFVCLLCTISCPPGIRLHAAVHILAIT